jgi:hypothetical protein
MSLEYDTTTRRIRVQITETAYRAIEKEAEALGKSVSSVARSCIESGAEKLIRKLTLEDELIVNERIKKNIEARMAAREASK